MPSYRTDHSAAVLKIECNKDSKRGPGFWKLNESLLENKQNLDGMNKILDSVIGRRKDANKGIR